MSDFTKTKELIEREVNNAREKFASNGYDFDETSEVIFRAGIQIGMSIGGVALTELDTTDIVNI